MSKSSDTISIVDLEFDDGVAAVTINRPHRHNSLVPVLLQKLSAAFRIINEQHQDVKVVVLQATGDSFSTGGDLGAFYQHRDDVKSYANKIVGDLNDAIISIIECTVPVVAAVDGQVTGGSIGLVLACDIVIVTNRASFTPYYTEIGFGPDGGWTALLPAIVGQRRAAAVQLLNDTISGQQAVDWGIAYSLVDASGLQQALEDVCSRIKCKKEGSVQLTKQLLRNSNYRDLLDREREAFVEQIAKREAIEGVDEFVNGRGESV